MGLMMRPRPRCCGQLRSRPWRSFVAPKSGAATAVMTGVTEAPGVAAAMVVAVVTVGVATPTTAVEEATAAKAE